MQIECKFFLATGYSYCSVYDLAQFYHAANVLELHKGTEEAEKIVISRKILGKL